MAFVDEDTLYLKWPSARAGPSFSVHAIRGNTDRRGGRIQVDSQHRETHRHIAYTTNSHILSNEIVAAGGGYLCVKLQVEAAEDSGFLLNITPDLGLNRIMPRPEKVLDDAERRWHNWFAAAQPRPLGYIQSPWTASWRHLGHTRRPFPRRSLKSHRNSLQPSANPSLHMHAGPIAASSADSFASDQGSSAQVSPLNVSILQYSCNHIARLADESYVTLLEGDLPWGRKAWAQTVGMFFALRLGKD
jgi:hypothetical protein